MIHSSSFRAFSAVLFFTCVGEALAQAPAERNVRLTFLCEIAEVPPGAKTVDLWIPIPTSNERQTIKLLNERELGAGRFTSDKIFGNRLYHRRFEVPSDGTAMP